MYYHSKVDHSGGRIRVISYEKEYVPPSSQMSEDGKSMYLVGQAYYQYYIVKTCDVCNDVWWEKDTPKIVQYHGSVVK